MDDDTPSASPDAPPVRQLREAQLVWAALAGGVALATLTLGGFVLAGYGGGAQRYAEPLFFADAALNFAAIVGAFYVQRQMVLRLPPEASRADVVGAVRHAGVRSLAFLEASALVACCLAFATGQIVHLLFVAPFFAFALAFLPTPRRIDALRAVTLPE